MWSLDTATSATSPPTSTAPSTTRRPAAGRGWCCGPTCSRRPLDACGRAPAPAARLDPARRAADPGPRPPARRGPGRRSCCAAGSRVSTSGFSRRARSNRSRRRLCPVGRRARRDGPARRLRSPAPRGNGRGLQRRGGKLRSGASRISALYPTCHMGRAHDPRSAAIGGSCEDRGVATRTRCRGHTAKAAGPDRAPRGRIAGTALWRAATKTKAKTQ